MDLGKRLRVAGCGCVLLAAAVSFGQAGSGQAMPSQDVSSQGPEVLSAVPSSEAQQLLDLTNQARDAEGLGPLRWDLALAAAAEQHTERMRGEAELAHQYPEEEPLVTRAGQAGAHFSSIAENIAMGPSPAAIEREWLHSVPHRANIFDPRMNRIGIAVVRRGGDFYATEDFSQGVESVGAEQAEAKVAALLRQSGLTVTTDAAAVRQARQTCEMSQGSAGGTQPRFIVRWESSSLAQLPPQLTERIALGQSKTAVAGSCTSMHPQQGFTTYRMAVLLF